MHRIFWPAVALSLLTLIVGVISLWRVDWISPRRAVRISMSSGGVHAWFGRRGDYAVFSPGFTVGGWTGPKQWSAKFNNAERIYVQSGPLSPIPGMGVPAKPIVGLSLRLPMYIPLLVAIIAAVILYRPYRRRHIPPGACAVCGYDVRGLNTRCPECGTDILRRFNATIAFIFGPSRSRDRAPFTAPVMTASASDTPARRSC